MLGAVAITILLIEFGELVYGFSNTSDYLTAIPGIVKKFLRETLFVFTMVPP